MRPLAYMPDGSEGTIVKIIAGRGLTRRLYEMGFVPGEKVKVIRSSGPGPVLVLIKDSRMAIGRGVAMKIIVESKGN